MTERPGWELLRLGSFPERLPDLEGFAPPAERYWIRPLGSPLDEVALARALEELSASPARRLALKGAEGLLPLVGCPLQALWLQETGRVDLSPLGRMSSLGELRLRGVDLEEHTAFLRGLERLERLDLAGPGTLVDADLAPLAGLPLRSLSLRGRRLRGEGLAWLRGCPLEELDLGATALEHPSLAHLEGLPLRRLRMASNALVDMAALQRRLERRARDDLAARMVLGEAWSDRYEFRDQGYGDFDVQVLDPLPPDPSPRGPDPRPPGERMSLLRSAASLFELPLEGLVEPLEGLRSLSALPALRELDLGDCPVGDEELGWLRGLPVRSLSLRRTSVSDAGLELLPAGLEHLGLEATEVTASGLARLPPLLGLRLGALHLHGPLEDPRLEELALLFVELGPLAWELPRLRRLVLYRCTLPDLRPFAELPALRSLDLSGSTVQDFAGLEALSQLEELRLSRTPLDDAELHRLRSLRGLKVLGLGFTQATRPALEALQESLPDTRLEIAVKED